MKEEIEKLLKEFEKRVSEIRSFSEWKDLFSEYLGKKSKIAQLKPKLKLLEPPQRKEMARELALAREEIHRRLSLKRKEVLKKEKLEKETSEFFDPTLPARSFWRGHLHPLSTVKKEIIEIFRSLGFEVVEGPEIETEWYNFDALNIPKEHPARDAWDTFWLEQDRTEDRYLLRTHTSPVQIRYMEKHQPPFKIIAPGRVFRHENIDFSHQIQFWQLEGLMVNKNTNVAEMKAVISEFFRNFFSQKDLEFRLKPDYFPFTEPSFEISMSCLNCGGKGCSACKSSGWIEVAGAGMVHPKVLENSGIDSKVWQGWAFGFGIERLAMMRYKIDDLRLFLSGDLRFIRQF